MINTILVYTFSIFILFLLFDKFSSFLNIYDIPNERKLHKKKISLAGGVYIFICFYFYLICIPLFSQNTSEIFFSSETEYYNFFIISVLFFLIGFIDDKTIISSNIKMMLFFILIVSAVSIDFKLFINFLNFSFTQDIIFLQNFSIIFSIFSIFIFVNALNMYDGSNGQLGLYAFIFILYLSYKTNSFVILILILPLLLFLYLNFKNITFIGNSGSYFLGYVFSFMVIKIYTFKFFFISSDEVVLLMFYPVIELIRLFFFRIYNNKNPFNADRNHIHHILQKMGYSNNKIQLILFMINLIPLIIYELTQINIIYLLLLNIFVYFSVISKKIIFST